MHTTAHISVHAHSYNLPTLRPHTVNQTHCSRREGQGATTLKGPQRGKQGFVYTAEVEGASHWARGTSPEGLRHTGHLCPYCASGANTHGHTLIHHLHTHPGVCVQMDSKSSYAHQAHALTSQCQTRSCKRQLTYKGRAHGYPERHLDPGSHRVTPLRAGIQQMTQFSNMDWLTVPTKQTAFHARKGSGQTNWAKSRVRESTGREEQCGGGQCHVHTPGNL